MTQEPLQGKGIAAAVHKIFPGECMAEQMDACLLDAAAVVIIGNAAPQAVLCKLCAAFVGE